LKPTESLLRWGGQNVTISWGTNPNFFYSDLFSSFWVMLWTNHRTTIWLR